MRQVSTKQSGGYDTIEVSIIIIIKFGFGAQRNAHKKSLAVKLQRKPLTIGFFISYINIIKRFKF